MAYPIKIPPNLIPKFSEITRQYAWFPGKLYEVLEELSNDPEYGSIEFWNEYDCKGVLVAHYGLYYEVKGDVIELLGIERVFHTW